MTELERPAEHAGSRSLAELVEGFWITQLIGTAVALGIPDQLADGARSCEQLARSSQSDAACVLRLLRALQTIGVCRTNSEAGFELTERGETLRSSVPGSISGRALFTSGIMWDLYGQLRTVVKTGRALPAGRDGFNRLADHPGLAGLHQAMVESSVRIVEDAVRRHDFAHYSRVLDVGGGYGGALVALLQRYPGMSGSVLDLPYLSSAANAYFARAGVAHRAQFLAGDFFESVPAGYDCYLLKYIIHDWNDTEATKILRNCAGAARQGSHVILLERILPDVLDETAAHQAIAQIDLAMMMTDGKERTAGEYRNLLASVGLRMTSVTPTGPVCSLIHATAAA